MATDTSKIRSKLAKLDKSLDELESQLEPLFSKSLPETLLALDPIQQAKLHTIVPYVVYDLIFVYLKTRGIDPKKHRVITELERIRLYFDKIKNAEESVQKRKAGIDKAAAGRFIKHAIAQAKNAQLIDEPLDTVQTASSSSSSVPVKVTRKMMARAEYEKELKELGDEDEEDLEVFDEEVAGGDDKAIEGPSEETTGLDKGKGRASEEELSSSRRKRPRIDPFAGYENLAVPEATHQVTDTRETAMPSGSIRSTPTNERASVSAVENRERKAAKKKKKPKRRVKKNW